MGKKEQQVRGISRCRQTRPPPAAAAIGSRQQLLLLRCSKHPTRVSLIKRKIFKKKVMRIAFLSSGCSSPAGDLKCTYTPLHRLVRHTRRRSKQQFEGFLRSSSSNIYFNLHFIEDKMQKAPLWPPTASRGPRTPPFCCFSHFCKSAAASLGAPKAP